MRDAPASPSRSTAPHHLSLRVRRDSEPREPAIALRRVGASEVVGVVLVLRIDSSGGGGVSLERVDQAALHAAEAWVKDAAESKMRAATLVAWLVFALVCAVAPVALVIARRG